MKPNTPEVFTAPLLLGTAFLLVGAAIVEKGLNLVGTSIPIVNVIPSQLLDWAVTLATLEIALAVRLIVEAGRRSAEEGYIGPT